MSNSSEFMPTYLNEQSLEKMDEASDPGTFDMFENEASSF